MNDDKKTESDNVDPQVLADLERAGADLGDEELQPAGEAGPRPGAGPSYDQEMADFVGHGLIMIMEPLAEARGPHWQPQKPAVDGFGKAFAIWFEKKYGKPELSPTWQLVVASLAVFAMPIAGEIQLMKQRKQKPQVNADEEPAENGSQPEHQPEK